MGLILAMLCGCGQRQSVSAEKETDRIVIWTWDDTFNVKAAKLAAKEYKKTHKDIQIIVETKEREEILADTKNLIASKMYQELPDVIMIEDYDIQDVLSQYEDEFVDLTDKVDYDRYTDYKSKLCSKGDRFYGIPFDSGTAALFYRLDILEQAGYTEADMQDLTWDKYIEIGQAVQEKTGKYMLTLDPSDLGQIRMMLQSAGAWYTDAEGNVTIKDNQALKDAINTYKKIVDSGISKQVADWDQFVGAFNSGEVASVPTGCWISPSVLGAEDQSGKWAVAPFPRMAENEASENASSIGGAGWYVLKNVGHEDAAKAFLKDTFASNVDLMNQLAVDINLVSTLKASSEAENYNKGVEFYGGQEIFKDFAEWTNEVPAVNYGEDTYAIEDIMTEVVQAIVGGADVDETLEMYQTQIEGAVAN